MGRRLFGGKKKKKKLSAKCNSSCLDRIRTVP